MNDPTAEEIDFEEVARAIRRAGDIGKRLEKSGLSRRAVVLLLYDATKVGKPKINAILDALPKLPEWALTKKEKAKKGEK